MKDTMTKIAYFSAEIGISAKLPTYSGGLGVLAGDHIKAAADAELQAISISLQLFFNNILTILIEYF